MIPNKNIKYNECLSQHICNYLSYKIAFFIQIYFLNTASWKIDLEDSFEVDCVIYSIATGLPAKLSMDYFAHWNESRGQKLKYNFKWVGIDGKTMELSKHEDFKTLVQYLIGTEEQGKYEDVADFLTTAMIPRQLEDDCFEPFYELAKPSRW